MATGELVHVLSVLCGVILTTSIVSVTKLIVNYYRKDKQRDGKRSDKLVSVLDYAEAAKEKLLQNQDTSWYYFEDGATTQRTVQNNVESFGRYGLLPYNLIDVSDASINITILGEPVSMPIGISPTAFQCWAHPDGEYATGRAAKNKGVVVTFSAYSTISIEDIAKTVPTALKWQQMYMFGLKNVTLDFMRRSEKSGYKALVVTVDRPVGSIRYSAKRYKFDYPPPPNFHNFTKELTKKLVNPAQTWEELSWLRKETNMKIVAKGILRAEDARKAVECGVDAILVSNHGGRVLDGVPATIDVLEDIVKEVGSEVEVYLDGGIRTGMDVAKALALGARAVFIGRPMVYGLIEAGQDGVEDILDILKSEFFNAMRTLGANRPEQLNASMIIKPKY